MENSSRFTFGALELQHIIRTQHPFHFDFEFDSGDAVVGVVEDSKMISFEYD